MFCADNRHKFVATHADGRPNSVESRLEHIGKGAQELIAHGMPKVVVHHLEPVHVDTHDGVVAVVAVEDFENMFALCTVVNAGQSVPVGNLAEDFLFGLVHQLLVHIDKVAHHQK